MKIGTVSLTLRGWQQSWAIELEPKYSPQNGACPLLPSGSILTPTPKVAFKGWALQSSGGCGAGERASTPNGGLGGLLAWETPSAYRDLLSPPHSILLACLSGEGRWCKSPAVRFFQFSTRADMIHFPQPPLSSSSDRARRQLCICFGGGIWGAAAAAANYGGSTW